jgi:hypothetical protein
MRDSGESTAFKNFDPRIVDKFTSLKEACQACQDADEAQAQQVLTWVESAQNWCYGKAVDKYHLEGQRHVTAMWDSYNALARSYEFGLKPHAAVSQNLHRINEDTWTAVSAALFPIIAGVRSRQQQTHWTGAGADDYMKQLPVQLAALQEFQEYAAVGGAGVETPAVIQQNVFVQTHGLLGRTKNTVQDIAGAQVGTSDFFQRCRAAADYLTGQGIAFTKLLDGADSWRPILTEHIDRMTSEAVTSPVVLKKATWPEAANTDASRLPSTVGSKYTRPSGVGA